VGDRRGERLSLTDEDGAHAQEERHLPPPTPTVHRQRRGEPTVGGRLRAMSAGHRLDESSRRRIAALAALLDRLVTDERGQRSVPSEDVDAVVAGIGQLADELESTHGELEAVHARTAELERTNRDIRRLTGLGNLLLASETTEGAYELMSLELAGLFPGLAGSIYAQRSAGDRLALASSWGEVEATPTLSPDVCFALGRGSVHEVDPSDPSTRCPHLAPEVSAAICVPMSTYDETVGLLHVAALAASDSPGEPLTVAKRELAMAAGEQITLAMSHLTLRQRLQAQALRDPLTGLFNRRFAGEWMEREISRCERTGSMMGVAMLDVDYFKAVNDVHGHDAGDALLKAIAAVFGDAMRPSDVPCRYGGEEFLVLVPDIDLDTLSRRAETLRERVAALRVRHRGEPLPAVTVSAGIAVYPSHGATAAEVVQAADSALYAAKRGGRNQTRSAAG
jgi:diguanylate cyclase (GGDEF)-like protein